MTAPNPTFASLLGETDPRADEALNRLRKPALIPLAIVSGLLALWAALAPLSGAVIATGRVKVELNRKTVQHQEGGIVRQILVRDGDLVTAGQPLLVIGDVRNDAELSLLQDQLVTERIRYARASAESTLATSFEAPADAADASAAREPLARERALFDSRRRTLNEQVTSLAGQARDAQGQAEALSRQIESIDTSVKLAGEELALNEKLVVEARIRPQDINHVREGFAAEVRLSAFDSRSTPLLTGAVTFVSPDLVTSQTNGDTWFTATVEVDATALASRPDMQLQAGMPAELYVTTPPRTLFQYLTKPFTAFTSHAMRES